MKHTHIIHQALILAAGRGSRLDPHTAEQPKCLVEVRGQSILARLLDELWLLGVQEILILIGYKGDMIQEAMGDSWHGIPIRYIENKDWAKSNNIYSLYLACPYLHSDFILCESDVVFEKGALACMKHINMAAVAPFTDDMNGSSLQVDEKGMVTRFCLSGDPDCQQALPYKTVNFYTLSYSDFQNKLFPILKEQITVGHWNLFYEYIFSQAIHSGTLSMHIADLSHFHWIEIDNPLDLQKARALFVNCFAN